MQAQAPAACPAEAECCTCVFCQASGCRCEPSSARAPKSRQVPRAAPSRGHVTRSRLAVAVASRAPRLARYPGDGNCYGPGPDQSLSTTLPNCLIIGARISLPSRPGPSSWAPYHTARVPLQRPTRKCVPDDRRPHRRLRFESIHAPCRCTAEHHVQGVPWIHVHCNRFRQLHAMHPRPARRMCVLLKAAPASPNHVCRCSTRPPSAAAQPTTLGAEW